MGWGSSEHAHFDDLIRPKLYLLVLWIEIYIGLCHDYWQYNTGIFVLLKQFYCSNTGSFSKFRVTWCYIPPPPPPPPPPPLHTTTKFTQILISLWIIGDVDPDPVGSAFIWSMDPDPEVFNEGESRVKPTKLFSRRKFFNLNLKK